MTMEFSQKLTLGLIIFCAIGVVASYILAFVGKDINEAVTISLITTIMGSCLSYFIYQFKLKDSRNRHHVDKDGIPFENIEKENEDDTDN